MTSGIVRWFVNLTKSSPWLMIAVGLHVIVAAVMSVMVLREELQRSRPAATEIAVRAVRPAPAAPIQPPEDFDRRKIPVLEAPVELVPLEQERTFVPTEEEAPEDLHDDLGDPTGTESGSEAFGGGTSIGVGQGGHHGTGTPSSLLSGRPGSGRSPGKGRPQKGPTVGTEEAVLEGLRWLLRHQNEDGSWSAASLHTHCSRTPCIPPDPSLDASYDVGMSALALLAFLGQGISVGSKIEIVDKAMGKRHQAGDAVKRGVRWLLDHQQEDGSFSGARAFEHPENETLATMVLCEAWGLSRNRELERPAQKALDFLVSAQKRNAQGERWGWGLGSYTDLTARHAAGEIDDESYRAQCANVELSITCWVAMALRSAQSCGLTVSEDVLQGALGFALSLGDELTSSSSAPSSAADDRFVQHPTRAAIGMLIRSFVSQELTDPHLEQAAQELAADLPEIGPDGRSLDFYYWYFATLALNQLDGPDSPRAGQGEYWEPWNAALIDSLLPLQDDSQARGDCARGGWLGDARGSRGGRALYNTALNVLTLEVYYRFENVFGAAPASKPTAPPAEPSKPR